MKTRHADVAPYLTKDSSEIRELMHPEHHACRNQSLAEAVVPAGTRTLLHCHHTSEEIYHIVAGEGVLTLGEEEILNQRRAPGRWCRPRSRRGTAPLPSARSGAGKEDRQAGDGDGDHHRQVEGQHGRRDGQILPARPGRDSPSTPRRLKVLLPTTLPTAMSRSPRTAAMTEVATSGSEVPAATMVSPTTTSLIPRRGRS
jgi:hypothetical protein